MPGPLLPFAKTEIQQRGNIRILDCRVRILDRRVRLQRLQRLRGREREHLLRKQAPTPLRCLRTLQDREDLGGGLGTCVRGA